VDAASFGSASSRKTRPSRSRRAISALAAVGSLWIPHCLDRPRNSERVTPPRCAGRSTAQTSCSGTPASRPCTRKGSPRNSAGEICGIFVSRFLFHFRAAPVANPLIWECNAHKTQSPRLFRRTSNESQQCLQQNSGPHRSAQNIAVCQSSIRKNFETGSRKLIRAFWLLRCLPLEWGCVRLRCFVLGLGIHLRKWGEDCAFGHIPAGGISLESGRDCRLESGSPGD